MIDYHSRQAIRKGIKFYHNLLRYQKYQVENFILEGFTEDSPEIIIGRNAIEFFEKSIRECQTLLEIRRG